MAFNYASEFSCRNSEKGVVDEYGDATLVISVTSNNVVINNQLTTFSRFLGKIVGI